MNQLSIRDKELYPESLKFTLDQLTINENPNVVGSTAYIQHKYPSDVDVYEVVTVSMNQDNAVKFYASQIKNIIEKIIINENLFFADMKIGIDPRFEVNLNNTNIQDRRNIALDFLKNKLIDDNVYLKLYKLADNKDKYFNYIRNFRILRWTQNEIIKEKKTLSGDKFITLNMAVQQDALIKLDVITWIISRYVSVEVFFNLQYKDLGTGQIIAFHQIPSYVQTMVHDIEFYSQPSKYNPLKVAKRMWSLSRITECSDLLKEINPLLSSNSAALNQIVGDIESIDIMFDEINENVLTTSDIDRVFLEILGFQKRIANHDLNVDFIESKIQEIYEIYDKWDKLGKPLYECDDNNKCYCLQIKNMLTIINIIASILKIDIIEKSDKFLKQVNAMNITCNNPRFIKI
uniref:Nucleotidyl transferase n=1 Tax=Pithovirus LCPAC102 TaxID=2506587 RepID=A0A481Z405_9VIRU|nr:MAG: nucleotidyl transferase [Pithovirus LCPAC102]